MKKQKAGSIAPALKSSYDKMKQYMTDNAKYGTDMLNNYHSQLKGSGAKAKRMSGGKLVHSIHQNGGSWSDFTNWVRGAASTVGNAIKSGVKAGVDYVKSKPIATISKLTGLAGMVPSPAAPILRGISAASGVVSNLTGKGVSPYAPLVPPTSSTFDRINNKRIVMLH